MIGEWCFFKSYFNSETCDYIIENAKNLPSGDAQTGVDEVVGGVDLTYRRSKVSFIKFHDANFSFLFDDIMRLAIRANNDFFNFHISKFDYIQFAEYDSANQGEYKQHHDVFWMNNDPLYHRKLSAVIQLTDPDSYEGGDLELLNLSMNGPNKNDLRQRGTIIFFPSFTMHRANPVTKGIRHSLAIWIDGPKWR